MANTIEIVVNAKNNADRALGSVEQSLTGILSQAGLASGAVSNLISTLDRLAPVVGTLAGAAGIGALAVQAAKYANNAYWANATNKRLERGFVRLSGSEENARSILESVGETLRGTASDTEIMAEMNKAMSLTGIRDAQTWARAMEIATVRGRELGMTTSQSMESMATGVGRLSAKWLDNMGIIVDSKRAYKNYAGTIGVVVDDLTEMQKREAFLQDIITYNAEVELEVDTLSTKEQAETAVENLKTDFQEYISGLGIVEIPIEIFLRAKTGIAGMLGDQLERDLTARETREQINSIYDEAISQILEGQDIGAFAPSEAKQMIQDVARLRRDALAGTPLMKWGIEPGYDLQDFRGDVGDMVELGMTDQKLGIGLQIDTVDADAELQAQIQQWETQAVVIPARLEFSGQESRFGGEPSVQDSQYATGAR